MDILKGETCPMCMKKTLTLHEAEQDVPFFGKCYIFGMNCETCGYHKADVEALEQHEPVSYTVKVENEEDLKIRIIKSSTAKVKIPYVGDIEPGETSNGYITNVEGIINRMKKQVEHLRDAEEDKEVQKKCKNLLKKIGKILWGQESCTITIEDPAGNSAIVSEKATKKKLK